LRRILKRLEKPAILYHLHQGPSTRIVWLAGELGIPLQVREVSPEQSQQSQRSLGKGGMVTTFIDENLHLLESGAILIYLLEKYDTNGTLTPPIGSKERAIFFKFLFYTSSTADHLIFNSYKEMFVVSSSESNTELIRTNKTIWDEEVALELEKELQQKKYICGDNFNAADIMIGWTLFTASSLNWLEGHEILQRYLDLLSSRPAFQRSFLSQ